MQPILVLASRNKKKRRELETMLEGLPVEIKTLDDFREVPDPVEDGETFLENAAKKALFVAERTGHVALADDSGLEVDALGGRPGVYSARYAGCEDSPDRAVHNNAKLLREMAGVPEEKRTARFRCAIVVAKPSCGAESKAMEIGQSEGKAEGRILNELSGEGGFGYDPLFFSTELGKAFGEAEPEEKNRVSHRGRALAGIQRLLRELFE